MWRAALVTLCALVALQGCATGEQSARPIPPAARATANLIIEAIAPEGDGDHGYGWDTVSIRTASHMHWHAAPPDSRDRPPDAITVRSGWIEAQGADVGVAADGRDDRVLRLQFDLGNLYVLDVLNALEAEGVNVSFVGEDESSSEHWITPPNREGAQLIGTHVCTPPASRARERCDTTLTLAFEAP